MTLMSWSVAFRNVFRNRRRTLLSMGMIAGGFSALILFQGFVHRMTNQLEWVAINTQFGHLQVAREQYWERNATTPREALLSSDPRILQELRSQPGVASVSGRTSFPALLSFGDNSSTAMGLSFDVANESRRAEGFHITSGRGLSSERPYEIIVGHLLAKRLGLNPGSSVNILGYTYDNVINAIEADVAGIFTSGIAEVDDTSFALSVTATQRLLDTEQFEKMVILLQDGVETLAAQRTRIQALLQKIDPFIQVKEWKELAKLHREVLAYYHAQNTFVEIIIASLVLLGILNIVGMSIFERTGEIGTIRSMGYTRTQIIAQFLREGVVLGVLGAVSGILLSFGLAAFVNMLKIPLTVPGASTVLLIHIELSLDSFRTATGLILVTSVVAAGIPATRASRIPIVDALKHNI